MLNLDHILDARMSMTFYNGFDPDKRLHVGTETQYLTIENHSYNLIII